jgi:predicted kinase
VIIDATYKQNEDRRTALEVGARCQVPVLFVKCRATAAIVEQRLRQREEHGDTASDATWAIAQREQEHFPSFTTLPAENHLIVDTESDIDAQFARVEAWLWRNR